MGEFVDVLSRDINNWQWMLAKYKPVKVSVAATIDSKHRTASKPKPWICSNVCSDSEFIFHLHSHFLDCQIVIQSYDIRQMSLPTHHRHVLDDVFDVPAMRSAKNISTKHGRFSRKNGWALCANSPAFWVSNWKRFRDSYDSRSISRTVRGSLAWPSCWFAISARSQLGRIKKFLKILYLLVYGED
jgi:hypothetical protein